MRKTLLTLTGVIGRAKILDFTVADHFEMVDL